jgi:hypothetical protein
MKPTIRFVVITALRDRLFVSLLSLLAVVFAVSLYIGGGAVFEKSEMVLSFASGAGRAALVLGLTVFVSFHVERIYETREIEAILARSISRGTFVASYWLGLVVIAVLLALPVVAFVAIFHLSKLGALWWCASLVLESGIVMAFALFAAVTLERAIPTIFATVGFYGLSRLVSFVLGIATHGQQAGLNALANPVFEFLALLVPRLDLFCQTRWLIYGPDATERIFVIPIQAAIFIPFLLAMTIFDLRRKQF